MSQERDSYRLFRWSHASTAPVLPEHAADDRQADATAAPARAAPSAPTHLVPPSSISTTRSDFATAVRVPAYRNRVEVSAADRRSPRSLGCLLDHAPHLAGAEGAQTRRPDVSLPGNRKKGRHRRLVVWSLDDSDDVVGPDRPVDLLERDA